MIEEEIQEKLKAVEADNYSRVEVAARVRRDPRTLDRWYDLGIGPPVTIIFGRRFTTRRNS